MSKRDRKRKPASPAAPPPSTPASSASPEAPAEVEPVRETEDAQEPDAAPAPDASTPEPDHTLAEMVNTGATIAEATAAIAEVRPEITEHMRPELYPDVVIFDDTGREIGRAVPAEDPNVGIEPAPDSDFHRVFAVSPEGRTIIRPPDFAADIGAQDPAVVRDAHGCEIGVSDPYVGTVLHASAESDSVEAAPASDAVRYIAARDACNAAPGSPERAATLDAIRHGGHSLPGNFGITFRDGSTAARDPGALDTLRPFPCEPEALEWIRGRLIEIGNAPPVSP